MPKLRLWMTAPLVALATIAAFAADPAAFPQKPIKIIIVPNEPGGKTDLLVRALTPSHMLGQPVLVENRAGASATIGSTYVARAEPGGYTLLAGPSATSSNAYILKIPTLRRQARPRAGLAHRSHALQLIVHGGLPAKTTADFFAMTKKSPGKLSYASSGVGTGLHLTGALFADATGIEMLHVRYKGTAPALNHLISGHVDVMFVRLPSASSQITADKFRALSVAGGQRLAEPPKAPTMSEEGVKGFEANSWLGILTPREVKRKLAEALRIAVQEKETNGLYEKLGAVPLHQTPEGAQRFYDQDLKYRGSVVANFEGDLTQ